MPSKTNKMLFYNGQKFVERKALCCVEERDVNIGCVISRYERKGAWFEHRLRVCMCLHLQMREDVMCLSDK